MRLLFHFLVAAMLPLGLCAQQPNIVLVIADDMGLDPVPGYLPGPLKASMPNLEALMAQGLTFDNVWADPLCSPTRSTILTGRYGLYTGVLNAGAASLIAPTEVTLHHYLNTIGSGYATSIIGKWHLGGTAPAPAYPNAMGIPHYAGLLTGTASNYTNWNLTTNGTTAASTTYITTHFTDLALEWIGQQQQPWFCWLAYTAPHTPLHLPPLAMHTQGALPTDLSSIDENPLPYYLALCESVDYELGRLLATLQPEVLANTVVIFLGDNGTEANTIQAPYTAAHAKGTLYEGGVRVPLVIAGPGVTRIGEREPALVNTTDLFATLVELTGTVLPTYANSRSMVPLLTQAGRTIRDCAYTEVVGQAGGFAYRNERYKYMVPTSGMPRFYDLLLDPWEQNNLLPGGLNAEEQLAYSQLSGGCDLATATPEPAEATATVVANAVSDRLLINARVTGYFQLMSSTGSIVRRGTLNTGTNSIDVHDLPTGVYHVVLQDQKGTLRLPLVKF